MIACTFFGAGVSIAFTGTAAIAEGTSLIGAPFLGRASGGGTAFEGETACFS